MKYLKSIERIVEEKHEAQRDMPKRKQTPNDFFVDWAMIGAREAQRWISNDEAEAPTDSDYLIKFENGAIRRVNEDLDNDAEIFGKLVTHWRPFERD